MVVLEAMSYGLPVICLDLGGPGQIVNDSCGRVISTKNKTEKELIQHISDAIIEISKLLTGWPRILKYGYLVPKLLRDGIYDIIAVNRYRLFGKRTTCSIPTKEHQHKFL